MDCLVIGDSIARGIYNNMHKCIHVTEIGINSTEYNRKHGNSMFITELSNRMVIISLGSNDSSDMQTERELRKLRQRIRSHDVIWIMPSEKKPEAREAVLRVAMDRQDRILQIPSFSQDGIHPNVAGYDRLVKSLRQ